MSLYDVTAYGAVGDGVTDDSVAIRAALAAVASTGGVVYLPRRYRVSGGAVDAWCLSVPAGVTLRGDGAHSALVLAPAQNTWARLLHVAAADVTISDLTLDGNQSQQAYQSEQQHLVFVHGAARTVVERVSLRESWGDGVYWWGGASQCRVTDCTFDGIARVGVHAQSFSDCLVSDSVFTNVTGQGGVKSEIDNEGVTGRGLRVIGNAFNGGPSHFGVLMSGFSATSRMSNLVVSDNIIRGHGQGIALGGFTSGWTIGDNIIDGCTEGIVTTTYSTAYGYSAREDVTITGNTLRNLAGTTSNDRAIGLANTRRATIAGNRVQGGAAHRMGIGLAHCEDITVSGGNALVLTNAPSTGLHAYRCRHLALWDTSMELGAGSWGVYCADDATYPGGLLSIKDLWMRGSLAYGVHVADFGGQYQLDGILAPDATVLAQGVNQARVVRPYSA